MPSEHKLGKVSVVIYFENSKVELLDDQDPKDHVFVVLAQKGESEEKNASRPTSRGSWARSLRQ